MTLLSATGAALLACVGGASVLCSLYVLTNQAWRRNRWSQRVMTPVLFIGSGPARRRRDTRGRDIGMALWLLAMGIGVTWLAIAMLVRTVG
jgi:hypothetical protein